MKKIQITLLLIAITLNYAYGQYGAWYYPHANSFLTSGKTTIISPGFVMGGVFPLAIGTGADFVIEKTDVDGIFTGPGDFTMHYDIQAGSNCEASLPYQHKCIGVDVIETNPGAGVRYAVAGVCKAGVFFVTLSSTGAVIGTPRFWPLPSTHWEKPSLRESSSQAGVYYLCSHDANTGSSFVARVDITGAPPQWANIYQNNIGIEAMALIESPYPPSELIVVGKAQPNASLADEAFFMALDVNTGNINNLICYSDPTYSGDEYFTSIEIANSTASGGAGYIIGGYRINGDLSILGKNTWMLKLDPAGNVLWSSLIHHDQSCLDVFERYNPVTAPAKYEYFGISRSWAASGNNELTVWKLDDFGAGAAAPNVFKYDIGPPAALDITYPQLDLIGDGTLAGDGLAAFATNVSISEHVLIKAYYNGVNGCSDSTDMGPVTGPGISIYPNFPSVVPINDCPNIIINANVNPISPNPMCNWLPTQSGGTNARTALSTDLKRNAKVSNLISIYPNPSNGMLTVEVGKHSGQIQIRLTNSIGQLIKTIDISGEQSANQKILLNFQELQLSEGLYFVNISAQNQTQTEKVMYTK